MRNHQNKRAFVCFPPTSNETIKQHYARRRLTPHVCESVYGCEFECVCVCAVALPAQPTGNWGGFQLLQ